MNIFNTFYRIKKFWAILSEYGVYLTPGIYKLGRLDNVIYNVRFVKNANKESSYLFSGMINKKSIIGILRNFFSIGYVTNKRPSFQGQVLVVSSSEKDVKIFDYVDNKVLTSFEDVSRYELILNNKKLWATRFEVIPTLNTFDKPKFSLVEKYINKVDYDTCKYFDFLLKAYVDIMPFAGTDATVYSINNELYQKFVLRYNINADTYAVKTLLNDACLCLTHGDLWSSNVLYDGKSFYHIDFEVVKNRVFFYDIMMFIFSEALLKKDIKLLENYLRGVYDPQLEQLFNKNRKHFQEFSKMTILTAFVFLLYEERWCANNDNNHINNVNQIFQICQKIAI